VSSAIRRIQLPPLYAILDLEVLAVRGLNPLEVADVWLDAGVKLIQLRAKTAATGHFVSIGDALRARTAGAGARLIVNDRVDVAVMVAADGVHVGQDDLATEDARRMLGGHRWVGLSTHTDEQLEAGVRQPVSYVAAGPVFESTTKSGHSPAIGLDGVRRAVARAAGASLPVVAIGGITSGRARAVIDAGAASVAVIGDLLAGDVGDAARRWLDVVGPGDL
jgi:thiamine-phosphate pyrophosphorylase